MSYMLEDFKVSASGKSLSPGSGAHGPFLNSHLIRVVVAKEAVDNANLLFGVGPASLVKTACATFACSVLFGAGMTSVKETSLPWLVHVFSPIWVSR